MCTKRYSVALIATAAIAGFSASVRGQTEAVVLSVDNPRPLSAAVRTLIHSYPIVITYEDPRFEYAGDLRDATDDVRKRFPSATQTRFPIGGTLEVTYDVSVQSGQPIGIADTLQRIVDAKNAMPNGGRFAVYQSGDTFHVVPASIRNSGGAWIEQ